MENLIKIEPLQVTRNKFATHLLLIATSYTFGAKTTGIKYELYAKTEPEEGDIIKTPRFEVLESGLVNLTEEQFSNWGTEDDYIVNIVLEGLGAIRVVEG